MMMMVMMMMIMMMGMMMAMCDLMRQETSELQKQRRKETRSPWLVVDRQETTWGIREGLKKTHWFLVQDVI